MLEIQKTTSAPCGLPANEILPTRAASAIAAVIEAGAAILIAEPWRIRRIVRGADDMTIDELLDQLARRRRAGAPADLNRAIALAQLNLALKSPRFCAIWADWRLERGAKPACKALISLDSWS